MNLRYMHLMAALLISITAIIALYIFLQRYGVVGLTVGALKN